MMLRKAIAAFVAGPFVVLIFSVLLASFTRLFDFIIERFSVSGWEGLKSVFLVWLGASFFICIAWANENIFKK